MKYVNSTLWLVGTALYWIIFGPFILLAWVAVKTGIYRGKHDK